MNATMQSRTLSVMQSPALGMPARCCSCRPRVVARQRWQPLPMIAAGCMKQTATSSLRCSSTAQYQDSDRQVQTQSQQQSKRHTLDLSQLFGSAAGLWLLTELPAFAEETATDFSQGSFSASSYYVTLGLFLLSLPGLWSLVKRAPKATRKRKVFEVDGPGKEGGVPLDVRARAIFAYFKKYNYEVKETGDVIRFVGQYAASRGQAAALVFYVFLGLASTALVLSIAAPGGSYWYAITLLSPLAGSYYLKKGDREEEFAVKMVTDDSDMTTDIVVEGDVEEIERFCKELEFTEKGKVYVKGLLER